MTWHHQSFRLLCFKEPHEENERLLGKCLPNEQKKLNPTPESTLKKKKERKENCGSCRDHPANKMSATQDGGPKFQSLAST